ncbi:hypothetical protein [Asticcacaulis machinosus]|uniref:DUF2946 domain-containing protein n=1 Tax=Asticcacaulis machinosus TaxID=2984211 RepID=A0ABT5HLS3_9CAUL|nr:hypothetical protein [Asticcacaulis machinosus]MDC7677197.1 hypothetical protein [Asticcacaulis machinosus]
MILTRKQTWKGWTTLLGIGLMLCLMLATSVNAADNLSHLGRAVAHGQSVFTVVEIDDHHHEPHLSSTSVPSTSPETPDHIHPDICGVYLLCVAIPQVRGITRVEQVKHTARIYDRVPEAVIHGLDRPPKSDLWA